VLTVTPLESGFDVILDRTAFFPEEGGQSADTGKIGDAQVLYVYERDNIVHHITDKSPLLGNNKCCLDFQDRYEKMQLHTAEHILCGILHKKYGYDNVGFHIGDDVVTFDINVVLSREILDEVEDEANAVVYSNIKVDTFFPKADELEKLNYRSKLDITDNVRIVQIGDVDACACCAPHVSATGEIGLIKMLHFEKHRGGTRIWMSAGYRALAD
jgi:alanyl-tRNA synthetase